MAHIINKARTKQRSLIITLLDLKNAFGEVHHNLIYEVLKYHHIPEHIENLIKDLYTDFQTSIFTEQFHTPFINVGRGVLQGDCLSPYDNIQYDIYQNTKDVLSAVRREHEERLQHHLISQGSFFSNIMKYSTLSFNSIWSSVQKKLPKNIFNFTIRYMNNTLPTRKNLVKWGTAPTSECSYCLEQESLLHVVAGCKSYLNEGRFTWRHDSVLNFIASIIKSVKTCNIYADLPGFISPSVITGDKLRPDLVLTLTTKCIYILKLTIEFESNLLTNTKRKRQKYEELINEQQNNYEKVKSICL